MSVPTVGDVDTIGAIGDPVIRNLRITQCYHELARAVAERVAPGANWCTFATWASRQAGQTIRGEDFARAAEDILESHEVAQVITDIVRLSSRTAGTLTHDHGSRGGAPRGGSGSRAAPSGGRRGRREPQGVRRDRARVRALAWHRRRRRALPMPPLRLRSRPGCGPASHPTVSGCCGRRSPRTAMRADAPNDDASGRRCMLLGNLLVGLHEQTRLQPEIQAALDAAVDPRRGAGGPLSPGNAGRVASAPRPDRPPHRASNARRCARSMPWSDAIRRRLRVVITDLLMTLRLPGVVLHLGRDVSAEFPPELRTIDYPPLRTLLASIDPTPNATVGSGAEDWANLRQRMRYIADLFRCWHARPELFTAPFTSAQVAAMREGRRPDGSL